MNETPDTQTALAELSDRLADLADSIDQIAGIGAIMSVSGDDLLAKAVVHVGGLLEAIAREMRDAHERADQAAVTMANKLRTIA